MRFFQYGVSADVYSLTIIIFELFSGIDPFPGPIGQIFQAKMSDKKPLFPSDFPSELKELVMQGWSKYPKERPQIQEFKSALNKMLVQEKRQSMVNDYPPSLSETNSSEKREGPKTPQEVSLSVLDDKKIYNKYNKRIVGKGNQILNLLFNFNILFYLPFKNLSSYNSHLILNYTYAFK